MTRVSQNRILKEANGDISDHLRSHIHLTNCIHLKNHMHKQSPVFADRALMRDLIVLQRSRSLRDPSASPPGWNSPSIMDLLPKKGDKDRDKDSGVREGRRSVDKPSRRLSGLGNLSPVANFSTSRVSPAEQLDIESGVKDGLRVRREESSRRSYRDEEQNQRDHFTVQNAISGHSESKGSKKSVKPSRHEDIHAKTISDQLNEVATGDSDDVVSSNVRPRVKYSGGGVNRAKRRKFRSTRKARAAKDVGGKSEMSVASNSLARGSARNRYAMENEEGEEEVVDQNVTRAPKNGCGIPFNWSRIHHRGKTFLDMAGRSLSCGLSDSRVRKGGSNASEMPMTSDESSSFTKSDAEALPLLVDSAENDDWVHDYSGELGIFADNLLKNNDSDLASEAGSGGNKHRRKGQQQHQSLTQKYMPKSFRDLMGQNLVVQALSNAVSRKKIGFLYVFYGPHGTGKTSCARIFARALNCRSLDHPKPCGVCSSCLKNLSGKSRNVREVSPVGNLGFENLVDLLDNMIIPQLPSHYRVFIFDDCDNLSVDCWNAISKVVDRAPRDVVFILVCSSLDVLPHMIVSRCQKFFFPKLKDADIIYSLQWIASNEEIEIDKDALKLIASRSDGSLRDAEMTLEQLSLLGQRISVPLVQELVGLISDEKLVDLLDLALSADTVNTVKNLRMIMETGVEPLALMSQLATVITDILAGSYDFTKDQHRRKFFRRKPLLKEDMEKLRQALKTLSEAEKQLRMSNDKPTWLTAALLQLAPDQQYMLPNSSVETSSGHSPLALNNAARRGDSVKDGAMESIGTDRRRQASVGGGQVSGRNRPGNDEIWLEVLEKVQVNGLKEFLLKEGKIVSFSLGAAPTVRLMFSSPLTKSTAEKFRGHILQAFESVLGSPVTIEIRCEPKKVSRTGPQPLSLPAAAATVLAHTAGRERNTGALSEIVEIRESPREKGWAVGGSSVGRRRPGELGQSQSIVRGKVSLAHVIQQAEGQRNGGWSKRKAVSIAEKLEQENLRLEPRSRSLLCWKTSRATRRKLSRLRLRTRRPHTLLKLVSCGKCLSSRSPR